jgi:mannose-6-phosphate isomerase-like protein (cupin superfamily)
VLLNYYAVGRKNKLHTHPGQDHVFVVVDGQATFYDRNDKATVLRKGEEIILPDGYYYCFENTGDRPLALLRFGARKESRDIGRMESSGRTSGEDTTEYLCVDGAPIEGQEWETPAC